MTSILCIPKELSSYSSIDSSFEGIKKLGVSDEISITLPRTSFKDIKVDYEYKSNVQAPIIKGQVMGSLKIVSDGEVVKTADLIALENVEAKGFFGRLWSSFVLWVMSLFGIS